MLNALNSRSKLRYSLPLLLALLTTTSNTYATPQQPDAGADAAPKDADAADKPDKPAAAESTPQNDTEPKSDAGNNNDGRLSPDEKARLKEQLKREILEELLQAQRQAQQANDKAAKEKAAGQEAAKANKDGKTSAKKLKKPSPLAPDGQQKTLADHAIANDKNRYRPGTGMHLESDDGAFAVATRLRAQLRHEISFGPGDDSLEQVFQIRRARLQFKGHAFNKHNKYKIEFAFSPRDLSMKDGVPHRTPLLTWYLEFDYLRDLTVRAGQYKIPYSRQRVVSSGDLQLVDRALANGEFNHDRDIGFDLRSKDLGGLGGYLRYYAGVYMGEGRDFGDKNATPDFKLHYLGRFEVLPFGKFKDYKEADMARESSPKLSLGAAYAFHHQSQGLRGVLGTQASDEGTTDYHSINADYAFKLAGFSSTAEFHWRQGSRNAGDAMVEDPNDPNRLIAAPVEAARNGLGWFVQAGYLIPKQRFEIAARYSGIRGIGNADTRDLSDADGFTSLTQRDSMGLGVSYYFAGHPWKLQADYFRSWSDGDFGEGSNAIRTQLQLAL